MDIQEDSTFYYCFFILLFLYNVVDLRLSNWTRLSKNFYKSPYHGFVDGKTDFIDHIK